MSKKRTARLSNRSRVIYQSEALFISPDATDKHIYYMPAKDAGSIDKSSYGNAPLGREQYRAECWVSGSGTLVKHLSLMLVLALEITPARQKLLPTNKECSSVLVTTVPECSNRCQACSINGCWNEKWNFWWRIKILSQ